MKKNNILLIALLVVILTGFFIFYQSVDQEIASDRDVFVVVSRPADMPELFSQGLVDGFFMAHPIAANVVLEDETAVYLVHSSEVWPSHPGSTLGAVIEDEKVLSALAWAHVKATEFINDETNKEQIIDYAMEFTGRDKETVRESLIQTKHTDFPSFEATKELLEVLIEDDFVLQSMEELGYETEDDFLHYFLDNSYVDYVKDNPEWTPEFVEETVRLGYVESVLTYMTAYVAKEEGYFDSVFADIELIPFVNAPTVMDAYAANLIDAAYNGIGGSMLKVLNEDYSVTIIGGGNAEGQSLVVRDHIETAEDLKGKTIATSGPGTTPDFLLRMYLQEEGLNYQIKED